MTTPDAIQRHIENLGARDQTTREEAIERLVEIGEPAVEPLIQVMRKPLPKDDMVHVNQAQRRQQGAMEVVHRIGKPAVAALINAVSGKKSKGKELFLPLLIELGVEEARDTIHQMLHREFIIARRIRTQRAIRLVAVCSYILLMILGDLGVLSGIGRIVKFFAIVFMVFATADIAVGTRQKSLSALAKTHRTEWCGLFALFLTDADMDVRKMAEEILIELLPQLKASDQAQFTASEMEALIKAINRKKPELTLAILKALEQIGDERALPRVEALAAELAEAQGGWFRNLYEAAQSCLPFLRERAEQSRQAHTLLRASSPSEFIPAEALLRPVENSDMTPAEELVRPTH